MTPDSGPDPDTTAGGLADDPLAMTVNFVMLGSIIFLAAATTNFLVRQLFGDVGREDGRSR